LVQSHAPGQGAVGDCYRTCIATILDLHPSDVPHFIGDTWHEDKSATESAVNSWLNERGLAKAYFPFPSDCDLEYVLKFSKNLCPGVPMILSAKHGDLHHATVIMDGKLVCDPQGRCDERGTGLVPCDDGMYWVEVISVGHRPRTMI
jgi:hypothetical protein